MDTVDSSFFSTGLFATARLVGRTPQKERILELLRDSSPEPKAIIIIDEGGAGKTKLLEEALRLAQETQDVLAAREPVDFYLMPPHIRYGLADAFYRVLDVPPSEADRFAGLRNEVERLHAIGDATSAARIREEAVADFVKYLLQITNQRRVVVALDTAERLVYAIKGLPKFIPDVADSWKWLLELLPQLKNFVFLLAGRPNARRLLEDLKQIPALKQEEIRLGPFTAPECDEYFQALAETARLRERADIAKRIESVSADQRQVVYKLSEGKPISLSLFADLVALEYPLPDPLRMSFAQIQAASDPELSEMRARLNEDLIARLIESSDVGKTVTAMGRAQRGVNVELLHRLLEVSPEEAEANLKAFSYLSIARKRRAEQEPETAEDRRILERWFLHDEMYKLLKEYVYSSPLDAPEAKKAADIIQQYYFDRLAARRKELDAVYEPVERQGLEPNRKLLSFVKARLGNLQTEDVYYRLKHDPLIGFRAFYRYSRQATLSGETEIDFRLRSVLLEFLAEREGDAQPTDPDGLDISQVLGNLAMHPIVRDWAEGKYERALEHVNRYRNEGQELLNQGGPGNKAVLDIWEAYLWTTIGGDENLRHAREMLDRVLAELDPHIRQDIAQDLKSARDWRAKAVYALGFRVRGYLFRTSGRLHRAVADYAAAARLWRELDILAESAETLNGLGFVLASLGEFGDARALVKDAVELRRQIGPRYPVGLSLNTLAIIRLYEGNYEAAIKETERALAIFRGLQHRRGIGLANLNIAEALRRQSQTEDVPDDAQKIVQLRNARRYATEALDIFQTEVKETLREVEALIELGCAYRDWAKVLRRSETPGDEIRQLARYAQDAFENAAKKAGKGILFRQVDALVNLAWLGHFINEPDLINQAEQQVKAVIPPTYYINPATGKPDIDPNEAEVLLWPQIGKLHTLFGHRAFERFQAEESKKVNRDEQLMASALKEAARYYTLGLAYDGLLSATYRDVRRAEDEIYERAKILNPKELQTVAATVMQIEQDYKLGKSALRELLRDRTIWFGD
ncbi:MAG: ATP-binding protein [Chloroflexi bacterium]|nr:ATP-binding protein [Chloroflexota bacterium]